MPYKPRDERVGFHHVVSRGNNKQRIFTNDVDRESYLRILRDVARVRGWTIYAYCLMRNHYHLVLLIDERGLAGGMCQLNTAYANDFNRRHGRINHLFGRRYWNEYLPGDRRLLAAVRYVIQNPRRAGRKGPLEAYRWSSYAATIGHTLSFAQLAVGEVLSLFDPRRDRAIDLFREFCETPVPPRQPRWQPPSREAAGRVT